MLWCDRSTQLLLFSCLLGFLNTSPASTQITPDNTLGAENSIVTENVIIKDAIAELIEGGAVRENNLFHSFSEFNVPDGNRVYFASPDGIANILTRITGNNPSEIFGTLGVDGAASLFLLNPNGIVFGENASLDVSGSFLATTAKRYIFKNGFEYSAANLEAPPLLTINMPVGLQMGDNPGKITVRGNGHLLTGGIFFPLNNNYTKQRLQVEPEQTLSLIAGEIELNGGILKTEGGNIELASIKQGNVSFDFNSADQKINTSQVTSFGDIKLHNRSLLDTSGVLTGDIKLQGKKIDFEDASAAIIQNLGLEPSGKIIVNATDSITLSGSVRNAPDITSLQGNITGVAVSRLTTETLGTGKSGDIVISGKNLSLDDGGFIAARSFTNANTGDLDISIDRLINIDGFSALNPSIPSLIGTAIFNSGNSGIVNVSAQNINLTNGGAIPSLNFGSGQGGDMNIRVVEELKLSGFNQTDGTPSALGSTTYKTGNSGKLIVDARRLSLLDGSRISTATLAKGNAGQLTINASEYIKISGITPNTPFRSSIESDAPSVTLVLRQLLNLPDRPSGNSGNVILNTPNLIVSNGATVAVSNQGLGDSGSLNIKSDRIILDRDASITAFSTSGQGGNIDLQVTDWLALNNNSDITAQTTAKTMGNRSNVNGGNININSEIITLLEDSQINANAREGNGGNINITTEGLFISANSLVSASSEFGLDGTIEVETLNGDRPLELDRLPENPIDAAQQITASCSVGKNTFAIAGQGGLPENPNRNLRGEIIWQDLRMLKDYTAKLTSNSLSIPEYPHISIIIEAQTWRVNQQGKVELMTIVPTNSYSSFSHNTPQCSQITNS